MSKYQVTTDGGTYEIETDDTPSTPQFSDIPANAAQEIKEAPQAALGMADTASKLGSLTSPLEWAKSAGQAVTGTPLVDTNMGQDLSTAKNIGSGLVDTAKGLPDVLSHPLQSAKNEVIQHPLGTAANVAGAAMGMGLGEGALDTAGQYAGRFGEDQAVKALGRVPAGMDAETARALGRKANDMGLLDTTMGPMGRKETVDAMNDQAGRDLGNIRQDASADGPVRTGQQMSDAIRAHLGPDYQPGGKNFDQTQALERELQNIQQMPSTTPADFASRASDMYAKAKGKGFAVPTNVDTDVAGSLAHLNDEDIAAKVPDQADQYGMLKQSFGDTSDLQNMIDRGEKRSINRPGSHTLMEAGGKFIDELGAHKIGAKAGLGAESVLGAASDAIRPIGIAGVTSNIMQRIQNNPQSLGRYAAPLTQAAAQGGSQGIAATHFILANTYPDYNKVIQGDSSSDE